MLSCWVPHPRPRGAPRMTYGRTVAEALAVFDIGSAKWPALAADRVAWRATLKRPASRRTSTVRRAAADAGRPAAGVHPRPPLHRDRD